MSSGPLQPHRLTLGHDLLVEDLPVGDDLGFKAEGSCNGGIVVGDGIQGGDLHGRAGIHICGNGVAELIIGGDSFGSGSTFMKFVCLFFLFVHLYFFNNGELENRMRELRRRYYQKKGD